MKRMVSVGAAAVALGCLGALPAAQMVLHEGPSRGLAMPWPGNASIKVMAVPSLGNKAPLLALAPARKPEFKIQTLPLSARLRPPTAPPMIPAGVYKTVPYSCIVVVPGPHPNDRCVINPGDVASAMPIVRPDLRFIPWNPAKQ